MVWLVLLLFKAVNVLSGFSANQEIHRIQLGGFAQGTTWHVTYFAADSVVKKGEIDSILIQLDSSLSIYKPFSTISRFNASKKGIKIDPHLEAVVAKSSEVWKESDGLFDITIQPLVQAWGFSAKPVKKFPDSARVRSLLQCVGARKIKPEGDRLIKIKPCVTIDVDGIAQGYSVDVVADFMEKKGVRDYVVEIGGEIRVKGRKRPDGEKMKIGIEAPGKRGSEQTVIQRVIRISEGAVTTSGNYRKFHESEGKKFSHTIDPRTGYPTQNELVSVTVVAKDAITADAYDNVLMTMGLQKAMDFIEQKEEMSAYFIYKTQDGNIADTASSRFYGLLEE